MARTTTPTHIVEFPLRASKRQLRQVGVRLRAAGNLYNAVLGEGLRRLEALRADPDQTAALAALKAARRRKDDAAVKVCRKTLPDLDKQHGFTDYDLQTLSETSSGPAWPASLGLSGAPGQRRSPPEPNLSRTRPAPPESVGTNVREPSPVARSA